MTSSKINQTNYNLWSESYDQYPNPTVAIDDMTLPELYRNWSGKKILEIGCGTGRHTTRLFDQGNQVTGIDVSEGMLAKAKEKLPQVDFVHGDFMEVEFNPTFFDKVIMSLVLEHIGDLEGFFNKVMSVLSENGEILISEIHPYRANKGSLAHFKTDDGSEVHLSSQSHQEDEIIQFAESAGLKIKFKKDIIGHEGFTQLNERWIKYLGMPMIQIWSFMG